MFRVAQKVFDSRGGESDSLPPHVSFVCALTGSDWPTLSVCSAALPYTDVPRNIRHGTSAEVPSRMFRGTSVYGCSAEHPSRNIRGSSVTDVPRNIRARKCRGTHVQRRPIRIFPVNAHTNEVWGCLSDPHPPRRVKKSRKFFMQMCLGWSKTFLTRGGESDSLPPHSAFVCALTGKASFGWLMLSVCSAALPYTDVPRNIRHRTSAEVPSRMFRGISVHGSSAELLLISADVPPRNIRGSSVTDVPRNICARKFRGTSAAEVPRNSF